MLIFNFWLILWLCGSGYLLTRDIHEIILASFQPVLSYGHPWRQVARVPQDGGKRKTHHKKQKYELGCLAANIKTGPSHMPTVRVQGGNKKFHALRLDVGNPSCGSECCMCKTQIVDVVHHASNNELVLTKILIKKTALCSLTACLTTVVRVPLGTALGPHEGAQGDSWGNRDFKQKINLEKVGRYVIKE